MTTNQKKQASLLIMIHLALMALMMIGTMGAMIHFIIDSINANAAGFSNQANAFMMLVILAMLIVGILYLVKGYTKQAAVYYKLFLILNVAVCVLTIFIDLCFYQVNIWMIIISVLNVCKTILLLLMAFGKDLGEKKTWTIFYMLLTADGIKLILAIINMVSIGFDFSFAGYVTALISDGTIGLAARGKYENKKMRGRT
ncbi:hypothetical protein [Butyrivibrio sp. WCE2006]|uniref:hypothetical protein n=1 Tax=Butyrivibrio sp. WCE2006 TaxID=1410611 RepID=UPI0005D2B8BB|nr:hypothetical protein [Butyrivibrio sp. WCE2006]